MQLPPQLLLTTLLLLFPCSSLTQSCSGVGYRDVCCPGLIIGTPSNANNLDGLTCCDGDPAQAIQIGLTSCTAGNPVAMTALASVSGGGVSAGTIMGSSSEGSMTTQDGSEVTRNMTTQGGTSVMGSGSTTLLTGSSSKTSGTGTTATVETVGGTSTGTSSSLTGGGAMITQGPLLLVGGAAALFAYGVM